MGFKKPMAKPRAMGLILPPLGILLPPACCWRRVLPETEMRGPLRRTARRGLDSLPHRLSRPTPKTNCATPTRLWKRMPAIRNRSTSNPDPTRCVVRHQKSCDITDVILILPSNTIIFLTSSAPRPSPTVAHTAKRNIFMFTLNPCRVLL